MNSSIKVERIRSILVADPRIESFEAGANGDCMSVVIVAGGEPYFQWTQGQRGRVREQKIRQWELVYDFTYRGDSAVRGPDFDIWISPFTNKAIPNEQMRLWLDAIIMQLRTTSHDKVLDIGCGTGLVLAELAPEASIYVGIDFSEAAIRRLGAWVASRDELQRVTLAHAPAHDLATCSTEVFDVAILNSVVQYFPDTEYLKQVLRAAAKQVRIGGTIFIGDLRAFSLLSMRAVAVEASRAADGATVGEVRVAADQLLATTRELAVDADFLLCLTEVLPRIGHVQFALKPKGTDRELATYRYDAILCLDVGEASPAPSISATSIKEVLEHLVREDCCSLAVLGLPNARLASDIALVRGIRSASAETPISLILSGIGQFAHTAIEPEDLTEAANGIGYAAEFRFTPGADDGSFDALLIKHGAAARWPRTECSQSHTSDPLAMALAMALRSEIQGELQNSVESLSTGTLELTVSVSTGLRGIV